MSDPKPRILLIFPGPTYRLEEAFKERASALSSSFHGDILTTAPRARSLQCDNFRVVAVPRSRNTLSTYRRLKATIRQLAGSSDRQYSLVSSYDPLRSGLLAQWAKRRFGIPHVCEVNGDYNNSANFLDQRFAITRLAKRLLFAGVARYVARRSDVVKILYAGQLSELGVRDELRSVMFPNRVAIESFYNAAEEPIILSIGFPWFVKGMDVTVKAFNLVSADFPDWSLNLIGHFPRGAVIHDLAASNKKIVITKAVHRQEMPELVSRCAFVVQASRTEAMGRALVESMAAAKPRIGTDVGGVRNVINDGVDGFVVPVEDIDALSHAMRKLMESAELRQSMGAAAAKRAGREFSGEKYYQDLSTLYWDTIRTG